MTLSARPTGRAEQHVTGARLEALGEAQLEAEATGRLDAVHRRLEALLEVIRLEQEEREVVLGREQRVRRPDLASLLDALAEVVEPGLDLTEPDEVDAEDVEQADLALMRVGRPEQRQRLLGEARDRDKRPAARAPTRGCRRPGRVPRTADRPG